MWPHASKRNPVNRLCCSVIPYVSLLVLANYRNHAHHAIWKFITIIDFIAKDVKGSINQHHFCTDSRQCQAGYQLPFICRYVVNFTAFRPARANPLSASNKDHPSIVTDTTRVYPRLFQRWYFLPFVSLGVKC